MPVIRGTPTANAMNANMRQELLQQLQDEMAGSPVDSHPVIFEIPLKESDKIDVLVVWDRWNAVRSEDRSSIILETYAQRADKIAQALGVTYQEAVEQQVLPYAVLPMARTGEADPKRLKELMLEEGGVRLPNDKVDLRFPTMDLARDAHHRLCNKFPAGYWSIVQTLG